MKIFKKSYKHRPIKTHLYVYLRRFGNVKKLPNISDFFPDCYLYNHADRPGSDLKAVHGVESYCECQAECQQLSTCQFFNHLNRSRVCYLKSADEPGNYNSPGWTFGPQYCDIIPANTCNKPLKSQA